MMNKNSKIYVAGHKGLVGSAILRKLKEKGYKKIITRDNLRSLQVDNTCEINHSYEFLSELNELETHINKL